MDRKVIHTRHVLAVKDLEVAAAYFIDKLGMTRDFTAPGWEFLSFGDFKVMLGECSDEMSAEATGNHSYCSYAFVENVDDIFEELKSRGAKFTQQPPSNKPWGLREFGVVTPDGHRIMFGQEVS